MSLMDRTKRQAKAAREQHKKKTDTLFSAEEEVMDFEDVVRQTRERVKAAKAAKSRAADLCCELQELQEEEESLAASDHEAVPTPVPDPSDASAFVVASLKSAVSLLALFYVYFLALAFMYSYIP